ncbi:MAG: hypothetical protein DWP95_10280 [Proteobacteria bacterium]|nr:MAG: hypothetical protein DWP95_10280 [Pseudomonadota bacterium]
METLKDRVLTRLNKLDMTQTEVAKILSIDRQRFSNWLSRGSIPANSIFNVASILKCDPEWLQFGTDKNPDNRIESEAETYSANKVLLWDHHSDLPDGEFLMIKKLDVKAAAGDGFQNDWPTLKNELAFRVDWIKKSKAMSFNLLAITINGDSMHPTLMDGDTAIIDLSQNEIKNGQVYAFVNNETSDVQVKRLSYYRKNIISIHSDNDHDPRYMHDIHLADEEMDNIKIIGRIVHRSGSSGL